MKQFKAIWAWVFVLATITTAINSAPAQSGNSPATRGTITPTNNITSPPGSRVAVAQLAAPLPASSLVPTIGRQPSVTNALFSQPSRTAAPEDTDQRIQPAYGGAKWSFGLAKTAFSANLNAPAPVTITTPDQRELRCRPSFLVYYDTAGGRCVLLGTAQPRVGAIVGKDKVVYTDAFKGIKADIRYTCHRRSLEQDVILRQRPADPATLGLNPQTTELQVWTEWLDSTPVATQARPLADGTVDEAVDFGTMKLVAGSAYASTNAADGTPVGKSWQSADGREFLVEAVPVKRLAKFFNALPLTALFRPVRPAFSSGTEMAKAALPSTAGSSTDKMELALATPATDGIVLDFVIVASVPVPAGAVSWWPAGGNAQDALPAANHGSWMGTTAYGAGEVGQGFIFNGSSDVEVPDAASLNPADGLTVEAWINENGHHYDHRDLVSKDGEGYDRQFILTISRDYGTFHAHVSTASGLYYVDGQTVVQPGIWYHVAMTYDAASSNLLLYVNGQLDASGLVPGGAMITTTQPVRIGGGAPAGNIPYYFTGSIDEPTIYDRALGASEIAAIYAAGGAGKDNPDCVAPPTGIVDWWPGDQNALDYAGTNNGTLNNSPGYAPAVAAQGFTFNGNNNVSIPDAPELNPTNGLTVEAWINENGAHYDHRDLVSKDGEGYDRQFILTISRDYGTFRAHVSTASGPYNIDGQTVVQPGTWYHVAMTYDAASSNLLLYVNGQLDASGLVPGGATITTTQPVRIGGGAPAGYQQYYFTGSIDEPALYDRALSAEEIESLYAAGCAGKCKTDLDADGLPDAWENYWFGGYSHTGDDWDDFNQQTLLGDYQNGLDPNVIQFTIDVANNYVNTNIVNAVVTVLGGVPSSFSVLVDSSNFPAATWAAYNSSNITVNISTNQGSHDVWIGLRGLPTDAHQTWEETTLVLDSVPPIISITNPVNNASFNSSRVNIGGYFRSASIRQITVNDVSAFVSGTNFEALNVSLIAGTNVITALAENYAGITNITSINIITTTNTDGSLNNPVTLSASPVAGFVPLPVVFSMHANVPGTLQRVDYDFNGDDLVDFTTNTTGSITYSYATNGEYFPLVTLQTSVGRFSSVGGWNAVALDDTNLPIRINVQSNLTMTTFASVTDPVDLKWVAPTNLYVLSRSTHTLTEFSTNGSSVRSVNSLGANPSGLDVDAAGNVYVAVTGSNQVWKLNPSGGSFVKDSSFGVGGLIGNANCTTGTGSGAFNAPFDVAVSPDGGTISVSDSGNHRIQQFSAANGGFIDTFGNYGSDVGQFNTPKGLTYDSVGTLYVVDSGNNRIVMAESSTVLGATGSGGTALGQFSGPVNLSVGERGVYVADTGNNRIQKFDAPDQGLFSITPSSIRYAFSTNFSQPYSVAAVNDLTNDLFYVADTGNNRVVLCRAPNNDANDIMSVWNNMVTHAVAGDIPGAILNFCGDTADNYRQSYFNVGTSDLASDIGQIGALTQVFIKDDTAQCYFEHDFEGHTILFPVEFMKENGLWKIISF